MQVTCLAGLWFPSSVTILTPDARYALGSDVMRVYGRNNIYHKGEPLPSGRASKQNNQQRWSSHGMLACRLLKVMLHAQLSLSCVKAGCAFQKQVWSEVFHVSKLGVLFKSKSGVRFQQTSSVRTHPEAPCCLHRFGPAGRDESSLQGAQPDGAALPGSLQGGARHALRVPPRTRGQPRAAEGSGRGAGRADGDAAQAA